MHALLTMLAQADLLSFAGPLVTLATNGGAIAMVWFLIWKRLPDIDERHAKERAAWAAVAQEQAREWHAVAQMQSNKFEATLERAIKAMEDLKRD